MKKTGFSRPCLLLIVGLVLSAMSPIHATDYHVDQNHPSASDQNVGNSDKPWKTITKANQILSAGDTVYIRAGTYSSYIAPVNSGTSLNPITYCNYGSDTVTVSDAPYGVFLDGKSYITVRGIDFHNLDKFLWLQDGANHNTIAYCNFERGRNIGWSGSKIYRSSSYNWVHHCRFAEYGEYGTDDIGSVLDLGNEGSKTDLSIYNLLEENEFCHGGHHIFGLYGKYNVIRNNYFHNENWLDGYGNRNVYLNGYIESSGWNLIEGNRIGYSGIPPDNWGTTGMSLSTSHNIVRFNCFYHNNLSGIGMTTTSTYYSDIAHNKIYHNTFVHNGFNMAMGHNALTSAIGFAKYSGTKMIAQNVIKNNIYLHHYQDYGTYYVSLSDQVLEGNWNGETDGDPLLVDAPTVLGDPQIADLPNFRLREGSPCVDGGTFLTNIVSADGSGTTLEVADAGYFTDGWGIIEGDIIRLQGTTQTAQITAINYETQLLTFDRDLTWTQGQGISLTYQGNAPDVGAFETGTATIPDVPQPPTGLRIQNIP